MKPTLSPEVFEQLSKLDTCLAADAIERFDVRLRNEGFSTLPGLHCQFPELPTMLGYAVTLRIRSENPPMEGGLYHYRMDWWEVLQNLPIPHVLVIQDADRHPGVGASLGSVGAAILQTLGCVGCISTGSVRDLPAIRRRNFPLFSASVSPSHAYVHIVDIGHPVEVAGLKISPGDLLMGDCHGIVRIPMGIAQELPRMSREIEAADRQILELCQSETFSRERLSELIQRARQ